MPQPFDLGRSLGDFLSSVNQEIARHNALPPDRKNRARACGGTGLIAFCLYLVVAAPGLVFATWLGAVVWAALAGFGGLWLCVGLGAAAAPRDLMAVFWSTIGMLLFLGLMIFGAYPPLDWPALNFLLKGFYTAAAAGLAMRLWLSGRGMPSTGLDEVRGQQAHGRARDATPAEAAERLNQNIPRPQRQFEN